MLQPKSVTRLIFRLLVFCLTFSLIPLPALAQSSANGLLLDGADPAAVQGVVSVLGVADHPAFRKWQLDLLSEEGNAAFLALGEEPVLAPARLAALDTRLYADGAYRLRLRVVHSNLNYDEYFLPIRIANQSAGSPIPLSPRPPAQPAAVPAPATASIPPGNGLSVVALGGRFSVRGVADHPTFRKWQIDLLLNGDANQAVFLAVGEERAAVEKELVTLDPADYPNGAHQLRLRVVYGHLDYDEYLLPLTIGGGMVSAAGGSGGAGLLTRGPADGKVIYLTFDDGPDPTHTPQILALLAEYNAKATFFVVGRQTPGQGELLKKMYDAGHAIGNHTWNHSKLGNADWDTFEKEVGTTAQALGSYGSRCLRPPYGDTGKPLYANAKKAGYTLVFWSVDPQDWLYQNPETIASRVLAKAQPGSIVLLHDGGDNRAGTIEALGTILATLTEDGYTFPALCR